MGFLLIILCVVKVHAAKLAVLKNPSLKAIKKKVTKVRVVWKFWLDEGNLTAKLIPVYELPGAIEEVISRAQVSVFTPTMFIPIIAVKWLTIPVVLNTVGIRI